jgi:hypothetical protein
MVRIRYVLRTKWNHAHEVIEAIKASRSLMKERTGTDLRVLSDLTGPMHTIVEEYDAESMGEWERQRAELFAMPEFAEAMNAIADYVEHGTLEIYTIEA